MNQNEHTERRSATYGSKDHVKRHRDVKVESVVVDEAHNEKGDHENHVVSDGYSWLFGAKLGLVDEADR